MASITREDASNILDAEDTLDMADDSPAGGTLRSTPSAKRGRTGVPREVPHEVEEEDQRGQSGPSWPPIYHSVHKKKLSKMVVCHLDGSAYSENNGTISG